MLRFYASDWNEVLRALERLSNLLHPELSEFVEGDKGSIISSLDKITAHCRSLGLPLSASYAEELLAKVQAASTLPEKMAGLAESIRNIRRASRDKDHPATTQSADAKPEPIKPLWLVVQIQILRKRIDDELNNREFFVLEAGRARYFSDARPFGEEVFNAFPSATIDIEEAAKCLALDRYTACVFHLMRAVECALKATAKALSIDYAPNWDAYIKKINERVDADYKSKSGEWKASESFFRDVAVHLVSVKNAWRNPTIHVERDYTFEQARDVFQSVRIFMAHLSSGLGEESRS